MGLVYWEHESNHVHKINVGLLAMGFHDAGETGNNLAC